MPIKRNMKRLAGFLVALVCQAAVFAGGPSLDVPEPQVQIICPRSPSVLELFGTHELRRYVYLRTGQLLPIVRADKAKPPSKGAFVVARSDRPLALNTAPDTSSRGLIAELEKDQFCLRTFELDGRPVLLLSGGDDVSTLYAVYRLAETLGVRFYLHGDTLPDERIPLTVPFLYERHSPIFNLRGIQPFHDFPEGPDWWNTDDYHAVLAQLPKLRMNFIGLHTYPEGAPNAEPTVWIGLPADVGPEGKVKSSYPSSYQNTLRGNWGYTAMKTSEFLGGASALFERDDYGNDVMTGFCPQPELPEDCNAVFERAGQTLNRAFTFARALGIKTCVGTEVPLTIPKQVRERIQAQGKDPNDPEVIRDLYEGIFSRIMATHPLDYYWFWTPEGWTWEGTTKQQINRTTDDLILAAGAAWKLKAPFQLATCGWVLGPPEDRALFDKALPKEFALSCINREVGKSPVDPAFALVRNRSKWAIPWLEDDPALTSPQLWVGRMRRDAADARRYGCDGLMGIHWRTRVLAPNVLALAQAAWDQNAWNPEPFEPHKPPPLAEGPLGGATADYPNNPIADTDDDRLYQTVRYNLSAYHFNLPEGTYTVTLKFCEPHYNAAGKRVFNVSLQGQKVIDKLDIFARVGQNRALDFRFDNVKVTNGWLEIGFAPVVEFPCIAAISIESPNLNRRINCGGPAYKDYAADPPARPIPGPTFAPALDFYLDWATQEFGPKVGPYAAQILARVDCKLPRPSDWVNGPGGIRPDPRPWAEVAPEYAFVSELEALEPFVQGTSNRERFGYWIETFRYHRAMAQLNCTWGALNKAMDRAKISSSDVLRVESAKMFALPLWYSLARQIDQIHAHLLATVSTTGELGTIANWEQHLLPSLLKTGADLSELIGTALPPDFLPSKLYYGPTRLIVPTRRSTLTIGEDLQLKIIVLSQVRPAEVWVKWRPLGPGPFAPVPANHVARGVYQARLPGKLIAGRDFEYFVEAVLPGGSKVVYPATAPSLNESVVLLGTGFGSPSR